MLPFVHPDVIKLDLRLLQGRTTAEDKGLDAAEPGLLLACFQEARPFGPDADRRFDFVITHDRDLVVRAAQPLLDRLLPAS